MNRPTLAVASVLCLVIIAAWVGAGALPLFLVALPLAVVVSAVFVWGWDRR